VAIGLVAAAARAAQTVAATPSLAVWALGGFLARGGFLLGLALLPLPSVGDLERTVGPLVVTIALAGPTPDVVVAGGILVAIGLVALAAGLAVGTWADLLVAEGLSPLEDGGLHRMRRRMVVHLAVLRFVSYLPLALAAVALAPILVSTTYTELVLPQDVSVPLPIRVALDVPWAAGILVLAWTGADVAAGASTRAVLLSGAGGLAAVAAGIGRTLQRPVRLVAAVVGFVLFVGMSVPMGLLAGGAAATSRRLVAEGEAGLVTGALLMVVAWGAILAVMGWLAAWRALWGHLLWSDRW
jgi:hypothetical protein